MARARASTKYERTVSAFDRVRITPLQYPAAGEFSPAAGMLRNFVLTMLSLEKERDRSRAGVRADDAADLSDDDLARAETRLNEGN